MSDDPWTLAEPSSSPQFDPTFSDVIELRPAIIGIAERVLTPKQLRIFVLHFFAGWSQTRIADEFGVSQAAVAVAINGQRDMGGILRKMGFHLKDDKEFQDTLNELKKPAAKKQAKGADVVGWFRGCPPRDFEALSVLHYAWAMSDAKGTVSVGTLYEHLPRHAVNQALAILRLRGWIRSDGVTIVILKTPMTEKEQ